MIRILTLGLLLAGCSKSNESLESARVPSDEQADASGKNQGAPVDVAATIGAEASTLTLTYRHAGTDVSVEAWGANGLKVDGASVRWTGPVADGFVQTYVVPHSGTGDLAVRVSGTFTGSEVTHVQSFTVGERQTTPVPTTIIDGQPVQGWDATRR